jgi:hypothetical protein
VLAGSFSERDADFIFARTVRTGGATVAVSFFWRAGFFAAVRTEGAEVRPVPAVFLAFIFVVAIIPIFNSVP